MACVPPVTATCLLYRSRQYQLTFSFYLEKVSAGGFRSCGVRKDNTTGSLRQWPCVQHHRFPSATAMRQQVIARRPATLLLLHRKALMSQGENTCSDCIHPRDTANAQQGQLHVFASSLRASRPACACAASADNAPSCAERSHIQPSLPAGLLAVRTHQLRGFKGLLEVRFGALCISEPLYDFARLPQHEHQPNSIRAIFEGLHERQELEQLVERSLNHRLALLHAVFCCPVSV